MSKVGSSSSPTAGARSKRTNWIRHTISPTTGTANSTSSRTSGGKRFVEPYRLSEAQRRAMLSPLEQQDIGDDESRSLFAAALEYDLAGCQELTEPAVPSPPAAPERPPSQEDLAITALAQAAESLAEQLRDLDDAAVLLLQQELADADRFRRSYGNDYLESLGYELRRVADAGEPHEQDVPTAPGGEPPISEDTRRFVLRAADAFEDCFELKPDAEPDSPFVAALAAIAEATGIGIPTDQSNLSRILAQD